MSFCCSFNNTGVLLESEHTTSAPTQHRANPVSQTLVFVDVDGVLNVGVTAGAYVNKDNIARLEMMKKAKDDALQTGVAKLLLNASSRMVELEDRTYADICKDANLVVDLFIDRLAKIIEAAGPSAKIVLSSAWRNPKFQSRLDGLEDALSTSLGYDFVFESKTAYRDDNNGEDRVLNIAQYLAEHCTNKSVKSAKVLVLDDFNVSPLNWSCLGKAMTSEQDVERFLAAALPTSTVSACKLIHTYDEWPLSDGMLMKLGCGLTLKHFNNAMQFLNAEDVKLNWKIGEAQHGEIVGKEQPISLGLLMRWGSAATQKHLNSAMQFLYTAAEAASAHAQLPDQIEHSPVNQVMAVKVNKSDGDDVPIFDLAAAQIY